MRHATTLYWDIGEMLVDFVMLFGLVGHLKMRPFLVGYGGEWRVSDFWQNHYTCLLADNCVLTVFLSVEEEKVLACLCNESNR